MHFFKTCLFILLIMVGQNPLSGQSIEAAPSQNATIESGLSAPALSHIQIDAFKEKVETKLNDFYNYLNLINNPTIDKAFREHGIQLALESFEQPNINYKLYHNNKIIEQPLTEYLEHLLTSSQNNVEVLNITFPEAPTIHQQNEYQGLAHVQQKWSVMDQQDIYIKVSHKFLIKKMEKAFGSQRKFIWTVLLSDIESIEINP